MAQGPRHPFPVPWRSPRQAALQRVASSSVLAALFSVQEPLTGCDGCVAVCREERTWGQSVSLGLDDFPNSLFLSGLRGLLCGNTFPYRGTQTAHVTACLFSLSRSQISMWNPIASVTTGHLFLSLFPGDSGIDALEEPHQLHCARPSTPACGRSRTLPPWVTEPTPQPVLSCGHPLDLQFPILH